MPGKSEECQFDSFCDLLQKETQDFDGHASHVRPFDERFYPLDRDELEHERSLERNGFKRPFVPTEHFPNPVTGLSDAVTQISICEDCECKNGQVCLRCVTDIDAEAYRCPSLQMVNPRPDPRNPNETIWDIYMSPKDATRFDLPVEDLEDDYELPLPIVEMILQIFTKRSKYLGR